MLPEDLEKYVQETSYRNTKVSTNYKSSYNQKHIDLTKIPRNGIYLK